MSDFTYSYDASVTKRFPGVPIEDARLLDTLQVEGKNAFNWIEVESGWIKAEGDTSAWWKRLHKLYPAQCAEIKAEKARQWKAGQAARAEKARRRYAKDEPLRAMALL